MRCDARTWSRVQGLTCKPCQHRESRTQIFYWTATAHREEPAITTVKRIPASELRRGDWIAEASGGYEVDGITVGNGLAYIGTRHGVKVVPSDTPIWIADE